MIGNPLNNPQKALQERIREMLQLEKDMDPQISAFSRLIKPYLGQLRDTASQEKPSSQREVQIAACYINLSSLMQKLTQFGKDILDIEKPTIESLAAVIRKHGLKRDFQNINATMPTAPELQSFLSAKSRVEFAQALEAQGVEFLYWFRLPSIIATKWEQFWIYVLDKIATENEERYVYQECRNEFRTLDQEQLYRRAAETSKKQLEMLRQYGKKCNMDFEFTAPNPNALSSALKLYICIKGYLIGGTVTQIQEFPAYLFIFDDRVAILNVNDKLVQQQSLMDVYFIPSTMYAKSRRIVDILGMEFSVSFRPETVTDSESLWKIWEIINKGKPSDYSMYQPVSLDLNYIFTFNMDPEALLNPSQNVTQTMTFSNSFNQSQNLNESQNISQSFSKKSRSRSKSRTATQSVTQSRNQSRSQSRGASQNVTQDIVPEPDVPYQPPKLNWLVINEEA